MTGEAYHGFNRLRLWTAADERGYQGSVWGTYKQWKAKGGQVRRGQAETVIFLYKFKDEEDDANEESKELDDGDDDALEVDDMSQPKELKYVRPYGVFNIDQVDSDLLEEQLRPQLKDLTLSLKDVDSFVENSKAAIRHRLFGGAYYSLQDDYIQLPFRFQFRDTKFSKATEAFESTRLHELAHWTGAEHRKNRPFGKSMNDPVYAFEELIALSGQFGCGLSGQFRATHRVL